MVATDLKRWHVEAARRARQAGFDIVYVYGCHWYLLKQFLDPAIDKIYVEKDYHRIYFGEILSAQGTPEFRAKD